MIDHTPFWYTFILSCIVGLRAVAPLSIAYTVLLVLFPSNSFRVASILEYLALLESSFYVVFYFYRHYYLQLPVEHPALASKDERTVLVDRCLHNIPDYESYLSKWFLGANLDDIKRDNVKEFFSWAFLNSDLVLPTYEEELEDYVQKLESIIGREFKPGRGNVNCIRLSVDKANILHRSLLWYLCVLIVDSLTCTYLVFHKFRYHYSSFKHVFASFPPRFHTLIGAKHSPARNLTYWSQAHSAKDKLPVLFLHGIGIGLYPYVNFLAEINQEARDEKGNIGIIAIETLNVSFRIASALSKEEFCKQLLDVLNAHGYDRFVLVSHSFGSFLTTYILHHHVLAERVASTILIDPVSMLLHLPDVAYNFMIRKPKKANEWQLWYFASQDAGVAHTLSRRFFWSESILWKEDIARLPTTIFLSERDLIINTKNLNEYLIQTEKNDPLVDESSPLQLDNPEQPIVELGLRLNVFWCKDLDHAQIFDTKIWRDRLSKEVLRHAARRDLNELEHPSHLRY